LGKGRFWSGEAGYPPAKTVRVAFAGAGFIAARHLQALDTFEDVQIVGVADVVPGRARSLAEQVGARAYDGHRAMLQAEDADASTSAYRPARTATRRRQRSSVTFPSSSRSPSRWTRRRR
jgi:hypothetical protein